MSETGGLIPGPGGGAARQVSGFLASLPSGPAAPIAAFGQMRSAEEAELAAHGIQPVSVVHPAESAAGQALIAGALLRLAREAGPAASIRGGNDWTTGLFAGHGAEQAALTFIAGCDRDRPARVGHHSDRIPGVRPARLRETQVR
ncbi:MAG: hypothetical protein ACRDP5_04665 [Streptosporangiaceae bacterium]